MKKRMLSVTALAVVLFYLLSCFLSVAFQLENILTLISARTQYASVKWMSRSAEEGKEALLRRFGDLYPHGPNGVETEIPYTAALWKLNGARVIERGYTLTVLDGRQEHILWQGRIDDLLTAEKKAALGAFLRRCPSRAVAFDSVSFATVNGEWVPTSLSMFSIHKANSVRHTLTLAQAEPDRTLTRADAYILFDFYDLGLSRKDEARFRRLEAMVSQFEAGIAQEDADTLFFNVREYGKKMLPSDLIFEEERLPEARLPRIFTKLCRVFFGDTPEWDAAAFLADGEKYLYFTASLCNITYQTVSNAFVRQTAASLGVIYGLMGAMMLLAVWRLLKKNERLDTARRALTAAAAHELKTPLAVIQNQSECVLEAIAPERDREYVDSIREESLRMSGIVNTLLQYNRLSQRKKIEKQPVELAALVREEAENYRAFAESNGVKLSVSLPETATVRGDEALLRLAVDNYLSNAIKYAAGEKEVRVVLAKERKGFRFETLNACEPMTKKEADALWRLLSRRDAARGDGSAGMGLPLCAEIFRLHGFRYGCVPGGDSICFFFESVK